ncbi:34516_t:CDS:2, partial [Racocetra persica]
IFTTITNIEAYKEMFISFFNYIEILTSQKLQFQHIHNTGLGCIVVDLDLAQAKGLGKALKTINPSKKKKNIWNILLNHNSTLFDTNIVETAYASINREGTKLKLRVAII